MIYFGNFNFVSQNSVSMLSGIIVIACTSMMSCMLAVHWFDSQSATYVQVLYTERSKNKMYNEERPLEKYE